MLVLVLLLYFFDYEFENAYQTLRLEHFNFYDDLLRNFSSEPYEKKT